MYFSKLLFFISVRCDIIYAFYPPNSATLHFRGLSLNYKSHMIIIRVFQQALMTLGGTLSLPFILASLFCPENENEVRAQLLSITMFMCGIATILQCVLGVRYTKLLLYYSNKLYFHIHWHVKWYNVKRNLSWIKQA